MSQSCIISEYSETLVENRRLWRAQPLSGAPTWVDPHWNFAETLGIRELLVESIGYRTVYHTSV